LKRIEQLTVVKNTKIMMTSVEALKISDFEIIQLKIVTLEE